MQPLPGRVILPFPEWVPVYESALIGAIILSALIASRLGERDLGQIARARLVVGVPWGTLIVAGVVLSVYLFVQDGFSHPTDPVVIPFRAWSYFSPEGIVLSPFTHARRGHLVSNLIGTLTLGVLAEYVWSHYPRGETNTATRLSTSPYTRVPVFVVGSLVVGLLTGAFSLGPAIGFSGVVFAYAGFTLTRYPFGTILAVVTGRVLSVVYQALRNPTVTQSGHPQFVTPWWAGISLQGHALGVFIGVVIGIYLVNRRSVRPDGARLWAGFVLFAVFEGLWAVYIPLGGSRFKLFQAVGVLLVFLFAALLASAVQYTEKPILGRAVQYKHVTLGLTVAVLVVLASIAVPYNLFTVSDRPPGITYENSIQVHGYTIAYAENIPNQYIANIRLNALGETTNVVANGVIVINDQREIWWQEVSKGRLAFARNVDIRVGGVGWHETVLASRATWRVVGNHSVYTVSLEHANERSLVYTSQPARAEPTIDGRNVTIVPGRPFSVRVTHNGTTLGRVSMPKPNETVSLGGLTLLRRENTVYAAKNETRVRVARYAPASDR